VPKILGAPTGITGQGKLGGRRSSVLSSSSNWMIDQLYLYGRYGR
jgi:hypothetical protein